MLDLRHLICYPEEISIALGRRGVEREVVQRAHHLAQRLRRLRQQLEAMQAHARRLARGNSIDMVVVTQAKLERKRLQEECVQVERELASEVNEFPNLPHPSVPTGKIEGDNISIAEYEGAGQCGAVEAAASCDGFCSEAISQVAGSGFEVLRSGRARMLRALARFALELHSRDFEELSLPSLVSEASMFGSGHLPKFANAAYSVSGEKLWLAPTAEVAFCALHRGRVIAVEDLPSRFMAHVACFRREIGGGGISGHYRFRQYHQVEMFSVCDPSQSLAELQFMLVSAEKALQRLELRYRVVELCSGQLPFSAAKAYKLELFLPRSHRWLDVSTVSLATDFLSRRSGVRIAGRAGRYHAHTLNASALACSRVRLALLEYNYSGDSGVVPPALVPYF